jgi:ribosome-associated protein
MIPITNTITLDEKEIRFKFIRSPGPGGQHVNKAATAVQLRFDVKHSASLPEYVRSRLLQLAKNRVNASGILIILANSYRSQGLNRKEALERLAALIAKAAQKRKNRRKTKPTISSLRKRKEAKQRSSKLKRSRQRVTWNGE